MVSYFKSIPKSDKKVLPKKSSKDILSKRLKGLGLIKEVKEKIFTPQYDYGF